jgi:hypothetical protein
MWGLQAIPAKSSLRGEHAGESPASTQYVSHICRKKADVRHMHRLRSAELFSLAGVFSFEGDFRRAAPRKAADF